MFSVIVLAALCISGLERSEGEMGMGVKSTVTVNSDRGEEFPNSERMTAFPSNAGTINCH
jgi:hypothetical protein